MSTKHASNLKLKQVLFFVMLAKAACQAPPARAPTPAPPPANASTPAPTPGIRRRTVRCRLSIFPLCFGVSALCPLTCPTTCLMDCTLCRPVCSCTSPGAVCQDPRFVGGDGLTFYFHGTKNQDFCLFSDPNLHINAHFIGKRNPNLKRDFTWVQSLGLIFDHHKLLISAKKTSTWDDNIDRLALSFDETPVSFPTAEDAKWESFSFLNTPRVTISRTSNTNGITVEVSDTLRMTVNVVPITAHESKVHGYDIKDDDCFAHLEVAFKFYNLTDEVDGVLGQTYRSNYKSKIRVNAAMPVMGGADKYTSSGIYATDCKVSRFGSKVVVGREFVDDQLPELTCSSSGVQGRGLVCKR